MTQTPNTLPPRDILLSRFRYDPETGKLFRRERTPDSFRETGRSAEWRAKVWNTKFAGKEASSLNQDGYIRVTIEPQRLMAHRLIWKMVYGTEPEFIDHINGNQADNRLGNLRSVPHASNMRNKPTYKNNISGAPGVFWEANLRKWRAYIRVSGKPIYLGVFNDFDEAVAARRSAETEYGFHENHGRGG